MSDTTITTPLSSPAPFGQRTLAPTPPARARRFAGRLRGFDPTQPLRQIIFYRCCYWIVMLLTTLLYRLRVYGAGNVPPSGAGGVLVVANHQSYLDPPLIGIALRKRNMASLAREGMFRVPGLRQLLLGLGSIALRETEGDAGAIRTAIAELKKGRLMLIFPEGSRSRDGEVKAFKRGAWLLLSRAKVDVVPAAVAGAFDAWPRHQRFPTLLGQRVGVAFGRPIAYEELKALGPEAGLARLQREVEALRAELMGHIGTTR